MGKRHEIWCWWKLKSMIIIEDLIMNEVIFERIFSQKSKKSLGKLSAVDLKCLTENDGKKFIGGGPKNQELNNVINEQTILRFFLITHIEFALNKNEKSFTTLHKISIKIIANLFNFSTNLLQSHSKVSIISMKSKFSHPYSTFSNSCSLKKWKKNPLP